MTDFGTLLAQQCINGVYLGCMYVLVSLGLTLIYGVMNQINFAHSDFVTWGAFAAFFFATRLAAHALGIPDTAAYLLSVVVAFGVGCLLGYLINATVFAPLRERGDELRPLIATIGVSVLLENGLLALVGPVPFQFNSPFSQETIRIGRIFFTQQNLLVVVVTVLTVGALYAFLRFTFVGKALRAVAQDRETAGLMGIDQAFLIGLTIVIASGLAGLAGALLGPVIVLSPFAGATVIVKAFAIVIIGGFGNIEGTILAGLLVGVVEALTVQYLGSGLIDLIVFGMLLLTLAVRPTGLVAERREVNV
ncbi:MAG: branched-chain amino acid ABC transporter permease [Lautropia sp.]